MAQFPRKNSFGLNAAKTDARTEISICNSLSDTRMTSLNITYVHSESMHEFK